MAAGGQIVVHAGPVSIRPTGPHRRPAPVVSQAVIEAIDDPVALIDGHPVPVDKLLRTAMAAAVGRPAAVTLVHPSWWPGTRIARVVAALPVTAPAVAVLSRSDAMRRKGGYRDAVTVEIAADLVAVNGGGPLRILGRHDISGIAAVVAGRAGEVTVLIDAPDEVCDAAETAEAIRNTLADSHIHAQTVDICIPDPPAQRDAAVLRRRVAMAVAAIVAVTAIGTTAWHRAGESPAQVSYLVEGRVAVQVPPGWPVRRVTGGPGSRRVEVSSPADSRSVLHITSSYAPGLTLAEGAEVLRRAAARQPPGVFVGFAPAAEVAGRPAVTYREIRSGRVVDWSVVVDGPMRISIGCQSAPGREREMREVCETAVASARESDG